MSVNVQGQIDRSIRAALDEIRREQFGPWTPTARQTSAYAARAWDIVLADTTAGAVPITLPAPVPGGPWVAVVRVIGTNAATVRCTQEGVTVNGGAVYTIANARGAITFAPVSSTEWVVVNNTAHGLTVTLVNDNATGGRDIDVSAGDAIDFQGALKVQVGGVDTLTSSGATVVVDRGSLRIGDASAPAVEIDRAFSGTTARVVVTAPTGSANGRHLLIEAGSAGPSGNPAGGDLKLRGGARTGSGAFGNVILEHHDGTPYLATDIANSRVLVHRNTLKIGTSGTSGTARVIFENSIGPSGDALWWDGFGIVHLGDGTRRIHHHALATGSGFSFEGHAFYVTTGGGLQSVLEIRGGDLRFESGKTLNWNGGTARLQLNGSNFITYDGTNLVLSGAVSIPGSLAVTGTMSFGSLAATSIALGADPADAGTVRMPNAGTVMFEAAPAGTDVQALTVDASERVILGEDVNAVDVQLRAATSVELYAAGALIVEAESGWLNFTSGIRANFLGELDLRRNGAQHIGSAAGLTSFLTPISVTTGGAAVASAGDALRLRFTTTLINVRNAGNSGDLTVLGMTGSDDLMLGTASGIPTVRVRASTSILLQMGTTTIAIVRAGELELQAGIRLDWASGTAALSIGNTNWLTSTASLSSFAQPISVTSGGAAVATAGLIAMPLGSHTYIAARTADNVTNFAVLGANGSNQILIGAGSNDAGLIVRSTAFARFDIAGATVASVVSTGINFVSSMRANFLGELDISRNGTQYITSASGRVNVLVGTLRIGSNAADSGTIQLPNNAFGMARNAANTANIRWFIVNTSDDIVIGETVNNPNLLLAAATTVQMFAGGAARAIVRTNELELQSGINLQLLGTGVVDFAAATALGGGASATLGTIGGSGPTAAAQASWIRAQIAGANRWIPAWL